LLLAFQQNWFHLIQSFLAKVIWFLGEPSDRPAEPPDRPAADQKFLAVPPNCTTEGLSGERQTVRRKVRRRRTFRRTLAGFASNGQIFPTYDYPSSSLNQPRFWASLSSIVDLQSLPSLLTYLHGSCIFLREKREEI
jgi:hypothetical protein